MNNKIDIPTRNILFYNYVSRKRSDLINNAERLDDLDDFILEILDFIWDNLTDKERKYINESIKNQEDRSK